jgi:hypothetical protein
MKSEGGEERGSRHPGQATREPGSLRTQAAFCAAAEKRKARCSSSSFQV